MLRSLRLLPKLHHLHHGQMASVMNVMPLAGRHMAFSSATVDSQPTFQVLQNLSTQLQEKGLNRASVKPKGRSKEVSHSSSEVSRLRRELVADICNGYAKLPKISLPLSEDCERGKILTFLATDCAPSDETVVHAIDHFLEMPEGRPTISSRLHSATVSKLRQATTPVYEDLLEFVLQQNASLGIEFLLSLRVDLLKVLRKMRSNPEADERLPQFKDLDAYLERLFNIWFSPGMLELRRITYEESSAAVIEQIINHEAVHAVDGLDDLRLRLGPGRRVFALFHPLMKSMPLVFVHVALRDDVPASMPSVMEAPAIDRPTVATFYSISSSQPGLSGVGLGEHLIKAATKSLHDDIPSIKTFVTLSPMPGFRRWVEDKMYQNEDHKHFFDSSVLSEQDQNTLEQSGLVKDESRWTGLLKLFKNTGNHGDEKEGVVQNILTKLAARYIVQEKHRGRPLNGVAKFHISNGASAHRLNYAGDLSENGRKNSYGMMINYLYDLETVDDNQKAFETTYHVHAGESVQEMLPEESIGK